VLSRCLQIALTFNPFLTLLAAVISRLHTMLLTIIKSKVYVAERAQIPNIAQKVGRRHRVVDFYVGYVK
jgi:hypothetical protein